MIAILISYCFLSTGECRTEEFGPPVQTWEECVCRKHALVKTMVNAIGDDGSAVIGTSCAARDAQNPRPGKPIGQGTDRSREIVTRVPEGVR